MKRCWPWLVALVMVAGCAVPPPPLHQWEVALIDGTVVSVEAYYVQSYYGNRICSDNELRCWPMAQVKGWRRIR